MLNYKTVKIPELASIIVSNAKTELAPILSKSEVDEIVGQAIMAIAEVMDRLFVIGHITDPHLLFQRGSHFFESNGLPKQQASEIFEKHLPGKLSPEEIGKIACYVKSKIMALFYAEYLHDLRSKLKTLSHSKIKAPATWNAKNLMISKRQNLHDFLRTTVAPTNAAAYFEENFLQVLPTEWKESYDLTSDSSERKLVLDRPENKKRSSDPMAAHIGEMTKHFYLKTLAQETHVKERAENGTEIEKQWAKQDLQASNSRLIIKDAKRAMGATVYNSDAIDMNDLVSEGQLGMNKAIKKFDPSRGFKLSTYSNWWTKQFISRHIDERAEMIRVPVHLREKMNRVYRAKAMLTNELGRSPTDAELADKTSLSEEKVSKILSFTGRAYSLNQPHPDAEDGDDMIESLTYEDDKLKTDDGESSDTGAKLSNVMDQVLDPKEARVLKMRYGIPGMQNCRHVSGKSLAQVEDMMATLDQNVIGGYEIQKIGDQFEILADDEQMPLETLFADMPEILDNSNSVINYKLTVPNTSAAKKISHIIRALKLDGSIEIHLFSSTVTISCPYKNTASILAIRNNIGQFLTPQNTLEIQSLTKIKIDDESLSQKLDHLLNGSAPVGILKAEKKATFDIQVSVLEKMSLEDIGEIYGVTRERIRQLEVKAMRKMTHRNFVSPNGDSISLHEVFGRDKPEKELESTDD